ncbi:PfkB family carbohydrate kinase [Methylobrevis pamukkalensis]|uniref:PfkB family carbohydrate kinase n=1 Tax=Methylobrevis pamukkalensis TaxID=1439726 RepID=A0A1E3H242_9HYPH|nr:PfkB family carbohydrate kinase [Methylobrevis pamukkalensis]ODN70370.1 pfkB family carbohydrate kinase [Methylobrevis pamukkalensis]
MLDVAAAAIVDVTGAGDALVAGTIAALHAGRPLEAAVAFGIEAGRAALSTVGALERLPGIPAPASSVPAPPTGSPPVTLFPGT